MPRRHAIRVQILGCRQQILELDPFIAADARHRRRPGQVGVGKLLHHRFPEGILVIQHIVRKPHRFCHPPRIVNIPPRAARPFFRQRRPMVIKLQSDADDIITFLGQQRRHDRTVDAARHRHDDSRFRRRFRQAQ